MADAAPDPQALALAHIDATGDGYRRTSRWLLDEHGLEVPAQTIGDWVRARRTGTPVKPNARTGARARATAENTSAASGAPTGAGAATGGPVPPALVDLVTATQREALAYALRFATWKAATEKNGGVARQWAETAASRRAELDALDRREREEAEWKRRAEVVDPVEGARQLVREFAGLASALARVLPIEEYDAFRAQIDAARPRD